MPKKKSTDVPPPPGDDKPKAPQPDRHKHKMRGFHLPMELIEAINRAARRIRPRPTRTAIVIEALEKYLTELGEWPPPETSAE